MKQNLLSCIFLTVLGCLFGALVVSIMNGSDKKTINFHVIFLGFGVTFLLIATTMIAGTSFFRTLKAMNIELWRAFIFFYTLCAVYLFRFGNMMVVAEEGWLSLYKHPFAWTTTAFVVGNIVFSVLKSGNTNELS